MRFPKKFSRIVAAAGGTTLGTDAAPTVEQDQSKSCAFSARLANMNGWPIQRVCVGYQGPAGANPLPAQLYVWDDLTQSWMKGGAPKLLVPSKLAWFDHPVLSDFPQTQGSESVTGPGGLDVFLVVGVSGGTDPDGTYTFVIGTDVSSMVDDANRATVPSTPARITIAKTAAAPLFGTPTPVPNRIVIQSSMKNNNAATILIGRKGQVDLATSRGFELPPGATMTSEIEDAALLDIVTDTDNQYLNVWIE